MITYVGGLRCQTLALHVHQHGPWYADAVLDEVPASPLEGATVVQVGDAQWAGAVVTAYSGSFAAVRRVRVVGGSGGWGRVVSPKAYVNDLGVKAQTVAADLAGEVGEQLGTFGATPDRLGRNFVRRGDIASVILEEVTGGVPWVVDAAGVTHVRKVTPTPAQAGSYEILSYDPMQRVVTCSVETPQALQLGSQISDKARLGDLVLTIRELEYRIEQGQLRVSAWVGGDDMSECRLPKALTAIIEHVVSQRLYGAYRYEVETCTGDKLSLRSSGRTDQMPERLPSVIQLPGIPGVTGQWQPGQGVIVLFLNGQPDMPRVVGYEMGTVPLVVGLETQTTMTLKTQMLTLQSQVLTLDATQVQLGGAGGLPVARVGDQVQAGPFTGVILPPGSTKVTAA